MAEEHYVASPAVTDPPTLVCWKHLTKHTGWELCVCPCHRDDE